MGSSHAFLAILPNIEVYTYTIRYKPGIKNTLFFSEISEKISLFKQTQKYVFFSRISFNIRLHTYTIRYRPNIKNI